MGRPTPADEEAIGESVFTLTGTDDDFQAVSAALKPLLRKIVEVRLEREAETRERPAAYSKVFVQACSFSKA
jgi:hypothetical protein